MTPEDNGILALVPGAAIGAGSHSLPRPGPGQPKEMEAVVDASYRRMVRIKYRLQEHHHGKSATWFWNAFYAEPAGPDALDKP